MLSPDGTGSCGYKSPVCRHGNVTSLAASDVNRRLGRESSPLSSLSAMTAVDANTRWWPTDASTSQVNMVDSTRCLTADDSYRPWTQMKYQATSDGLSCYHHDWTVDNWPTNFDDLLPTSETYQWMTIRRSRTKTGMLMPRR